MLWSLRQMVANLRNSAHRALGTSFQQEDAGPSLISCVPTHPAKQVAPSATRHLWKLTSITTPRRCADLPGSFLTMLPTPSVPVPPHFSAVIVYHNAGDIVSKTLPTVLANLCGLYEVILVLDGCTDTTLSEIDQVIQDHIQGPSFLATRVRVVDQPTPVWETSAENIGFRLARGTKGIVSIQADMVLAESCFNYAMYNPIRRFADVFSVSGRCAHNFDGSGKVGRCGVDFGQALDADSLNLQPVLFVRNSCNRGPLMFRADALRSLGFLDEHRFFQGDDDHDINARAKKRLNMVAGYIPLGVHGPISWGATRRSPSHENRDGEGADYMKLRLQRSVSSIFHGPPLQDVLSMPSVMGNRSLLHDVAVITGASANHFKVLYNFVVRMKTHGVFRGSPVPLFVIDFGLTPEQHWLISQRDEVHALMVFNFSHYPSWMNISNDRAGDYAWKAIGMSMVFPKHADRVLWLDSGDLVHDIGKALNVLWKRNFLSTLTSDTVRRWVHPGMLQYFKQENNTWLLDAPTANGAIVGFTRKTLHLFEVFLQCSLVRECVSPSGSSRSNHRQDQSIITLLSHLHGYSDLVSKPPEEYGISIHHPSQRDIDPGGPS